jgi:hypothetical protein
VKSFIFSLTMLFIAAAVMAFDPGGSGQIPGGGGRGGFNGGNYIPGPQATSVTTHMYDNTRSGWNQKEQILNVNNVASGHFGIVATTTVDADIYTQPLIANGIVIGGATHDVVYVGTSNDTVYAIDAYTGTVLISRHLGAAVPIADVPGSGCGVSGPTIGILGTPVIDRGNHTIYLIDFEVVSSFLPFSSVLTFKLHGLDLSTLADVTNSPVTVSASNTLSNSSPINFNASNALQRPALLLSNGVIYAAFTGYCDSGTNRGWLLGWNESNLSPLAANELTDKQATSTNTYFNASIWMSGAGPAADSSGNVYFTSANSDPSGTSWSATNNLEESVISMNSTLTTVNSYFTPASYASLDVNDGDVSASGVTLVPKVPGGAPTYAVSSEKQGRIFVMNMSSLGGLTNPPSGPDNIPQEIASGGHGCWCSVGWYEGPDLNIHVTTGLGTGGQYSGGPQVIQTWVVNQTGSVPIGTGSSPSTAAPDGTTTLASTPYMGSNPLGYAATPGWFPVVSSNGVTPGTHILWGVLRYAPVLFAYNAVASGGGYTLLYSSTAGAIPWNNNPATPFLVPTVANGHVYVGGSGALTIFGLH